MNDVINIDMAIEELNDCHNIYDIMSWAYFQFSYFKPKDRFNCNFNEYSKFNKLVQNCMCNNLPTSINTIDIMNIKENSLNLIDIENIKENIKIFIKEKGYKSDFYYNIIQQIDTIVYENSKFDSCGSFILDRYIEIDSLNTWRGKEKDYIYIFPKMKKTIIKEIHNNFKIKTGRGLRKTSLEIDNLSINYQLNNHLIISSLEYRPKLYILAELTNKTFYKKISDKNSLDIAVVPLTNIKIDELFLINENKKNTFSVHEKVEKKEKIIKIFKEQLEKLKKSK